jgi:hypothetical protein
LCDEALRLVSHALDTPPASLKAEVNVAQRAMIALRDALIDRVRRAPSEPLRAALERVNVAISLVVGLENPLGELDRDLLKQARSALAAARHQGLP